MLHRDKAGDGGGGVDIASTAASTSDLVGECPPPLSHFTSAEAANLHGRGVCSSASAAEPEHLTMTSMPAQTASSPELLCSRSRRSSAKEGAEDAGHNSRAETIAQNGTAPSEAPGANAARGRCTGALGGRWLCPSLAEITWVEVGPHAVAADAAGGSTDSAPGFTGEASGEESELHRRCHNEGALA